MNFHLKLCDRMGREYVITLSRNMDKASFYEVLTSNLKLDKICNCKQRIRCMKYHTLYEISYIVRNIIRCMKEDEEELNQLHKVRIQKVEDHLEASIPKLC